MTLSDAIRRAEKALARRKASAVELAPTDLRLLLDAAKRRPAKSPDPFHRDRPAVQIPAGDWLPLTAPESRKKVIAGDVVAVEMDDGAVREFRVRHCAWQMPGDVWVLALDGIAGGYLLDRVRAVKRRAVG